MMAWPEETIAVHPAGIPAELDVSPRNAARVGKTVAHTQHAVQPAKAVPGAEAAASGKHML